MESTNSKYFQSPKEAVEIISKLLRKKDWETLSRYYDLDDSDVEVEELESGAFFTHSETPNVAHPILGGYKHPFDPAFKYDNHREGPDDTIIVVLSIRIDQGDGRVQEGFDFFKLRKTSNGLQLLPENVDSDEAFGIPPEVDDLLTDHKLKNG